MTAEIGFYHLSRSRLDQALGQLLARSLSAGQRAVIRCRDAAQLQSSMRRSGNWMILHGCRMAAKPRAKGSGNPSG